MGEPSDCLGVKWISDCIPMYSALYVNPDVILPISVVHDTFGCKFQPCILTNSGNIGTPSTDITYF